MGVFEKYLSVWVAICILSGVLLGSSVPGVFSFIADLEWAHVNLAVAICIWIMVYPMMTQVDFSSIRNVSRKPKGLILTLTMNWLIKPFTMATLGWVFFKILFSDYVTPETANEYIAGMILLGVAPCTAMVFVLMTEIMKYISPYTLVMAINLEPVYTIILCFILSRFYPLLKHEIQDLNIYFYITASFMIISTIYLNYHFKKKINLNKI